LAAEARDRVRLLAAALVSAALLVPAGAHAAGIPDCDGAPPAAQPSTPEWNQREADNVFCGTQRSQDAQSNPAYQAAAAQIQAEHGGPVAEDPFRDPAQLNGKRFRWERVTLKDPSGAPLDGMLFRPLRSKFAPPYPGVVIDHGGAANQEMYLWGAEALAEDGYMVLTFQIPEPQNAAGDSHYPDAKAALNYLLDVPDGSDKGDPSNPRWMELDREHIGLAGHSAGGVAVSRLGQEDKRIGAIVSWDRAQSGPMPAGLKLRTPALFLTADFNCQKVPVCLPVAYSTPPDPRGPGDKDTDFQRVSTAGIDSMKVSLRAATHLDFTEFAPTPPSSRYGALVASYYTLAWFDRYLRNSTSAEALLTATKFDDSADRHYISGGTYDASTGRNVPYRIGGQPVANRLSFHFRSAYFLDRGRARCEDIRAGCPAVTPVARHVCKKPAFTPRTVAVHKGRGRVRPRVLCDGRKRDVVVRLGSAYVVTGRAVTVRVRSRLTASFSVDGRRYSASIRARTSAP
jgi:dienelactone hydrolase